MERTPIRVLFSERVIPNYRLGPFRRLAAEPGIQLTVSYWTNRPAGEPPHVEAPELLTVAFTPWQSEGASGVRWFNGSLLKYIAIHRPHVVIGGFATFASNALVSWAIERICRLAFGTRFVYRVSSPLPNGTGPIGRAIRRIWHSIYYRGAVVLTYGERAARGVIAQGCNSDDVFVDFNSMDTDELLEVRRQLELTRAQWAPTVLELYGIRPGFCLFVSRLLPEKRLDILVDAWKLIADRVPDTQLVVIGSGPSKGVAMASAGQLTGSSIIFIDGIYDHAALAQFYELAGVVVFPGYATLSTHFAMSFGKPLVCSQFGNEVEYVENGRNGYLYEYGDHRDLAEKLMSLMTDPELRKTFGARSDDIVRDKANISRMVSTIAMAIRRAADGAGG